MVTENVSLFPRNPRQVIRHELEEFFNVASSEPDMPAVWFSEGVSGIAYKLLVGIFYNRPTHKEGRLVTYNITHSGVQDEIEFKGASAGVYIINRCRYIERCHCE